MSAHDLKLAVEDIRGRLVCGKPHPLAATIPCLMLEGHEGEHAFGYERGMAIWNDGDKEWRYRTKDAWELVRR